MSTNLMTASNQWANRPADERFWTLSEMQRRCQYYKDTAAESAVSIKNLKTVVGDDGSIVVQGNAPDAPQAGFTNWSFSQFCNIVGAPASYMTKLPADLAVQCLNHGIAQRADDHGDKLHSMLFHQNGSLLLRAITGMRYSRVWNADVCRELEPLLSKKWRTPPGWKPWGDVDVETRPATKADVIPGGIVKIGDEIAPSGLYASDRDMFAFLINEENRIDDGSDGGLGRGFFIANSEVGDRSLSLTTFLYRYVCGNNIVWGATDVTQVRMRHIGDLNERWTGELVAILDDYVNESTGEIDAKIKRAKSFEWDSIEAAIDDLFSKKRLVAKSVLQDVFKIAEQYEDVDGNPLSAWGLSQALTRYSQTTPFASTRMELDTAATKILEMAS